MSNSDLHEKHIALVEAVNQSKYKAEHEMNYWKLSGWREAMRDTGRFVDLIACDLHVMQTYPDRPMCCGVLSDWEPYV